MGKGCDCNHCPGCGDAVEEPKKKGADAAVEPETEEIEEVDLGDDDFLDDDEDEEE